LKKKKRHLCPCLFVVFHSRNPHGLFSPFLILSYYWFFSVFCYSSSLEPKALFHTLVYFVLLMDWKSDGSRREGGQASAEGKRRNRFRFQVSLPKFPLSSSVFASQVFLSFPPSFTDKKRTWKGQKQEASE
jgi:hypothetical protein